MTGFEDQEGIEMWTSWTIGECSRSAARANRSRDAGTVSFFRQLLDEHHYGEVLQRYQESANV